jgi:hypothetical protein
MCQPLYVFSDPFDSDDESTKGLNRDNVELQRWQHAITVGKFAVDADDMLPARADMGARDLENTHVGTLEAGIVLKATAPDHIFGVTVDSALYADLLQRGKLANPDLNYGTRDDVMLIYNADKPPLMPKIHAIIGAHSSAAFKNIKKKHPGNMLCRPKITWAVAPDTQLTIDNLTLLGLMDNELARRSTDWNTHTQGLHNRWVYADMERKEGKPSAEYAKMAKKQVAVSTGKSDSMVNAWWQLAKRTGPYWKVLHQLLSGQFEAAADPEDHYDEDGEWVAPGAKAIKNHMPLSVDVFQKLGGIPDDVAVDLLQKVQRNLINWQSFKSKLSLYKNAEEIRIFTAKHLTGLGYLDGIKISKPSKNKQGKSSGRVSKHETDQLWLTKYATDLGVPLPGVFGPDFIEGWAQAMGTKAKATIPDHFKDTIVKNWLERNKKDSKKSGPVLHRHTHMHT